MVKVGTFLVEKREACLIPPFPLDRSLLVLEDWNRRYERLSLAALPLRDV
jgi:hypothetical protein